ncbi:MAG: sensor histidine kinase [Paracoccaceae bacterium]
MSDPLDAVAVPVAVVGPDARIASLNPPAIELLGDWRRVHYITALRQPALLDAVEACQRGQAQASAQFLSTDAGRDRTWTVAARRADRSVVLTFEDVTAAMQAGEGRREFVSNIGHELRTPLTALRGFIETLRGPARDDPAARDRFLAIMEVETTRMVRLVEDLLSLARVEARLRQRPTEPVDLAHVVTQALATHPDDAIVADLPATAVVPGDAQQLRQVIDNLLSNALKYGRGGVRVTLGAASHEAALRGRAVRLTVDDDGEGIAPHHIARLTERFFRADDHRARAAGGTGLGLSIVKHIVDRHRGRLIVESPAGQGARFTVLLPVG